MRTLPSPGWLALTAALLPACEQPVFVEEERAVQVRLLEPADGAPLPLSSETRVVVEASAEDATVEAIEIALVAESCAPGQACPRLDLYRQGVAVRAGRAEFCLTTRLAAAEVCAGEGDRLDVTGLAQGQRLRLSARASVRARASHQGRSGEVGLLLADDRAPVVALESALPTEDNRYGPGDRIAVAVRVTDEQSGVGQVLIRTRGLGGRADDEQLWSVPDGASTVRGLAIVPVPNSFLCPGTFELEAEVEDLAEPPNRARVALGTGCVGACSDHTPPAFSNVVLDVPASGRTPPFATTGDQLTLSFAVDDDVFLGGDPLVELVYDPPGLHPADDKSSVVAVLQDFEAAGQNDAVPGASYVYRYNVRGDEPPGRYLVRVTVVDPHCNAAEVRRDLVLDFTPGPTALRVDPAQRGATYLRLEWDLPPGPPPPLHLSWQQHEGVPLPGAYDEIMPAPLQSPYIHSGLTPASIYGYRLVAESAVTPGLFTAISALDRVCTLPAPPALTLLRSTQVSLVVGTEVGTNPAGTPLDLYRCGGVCGTSACNPDSSTCSLLESGVLGERTLSELSPSTCYALVLVARGCDVDEARAAVCARTQDAIAPPNWIQVVARTLDSVTFEWQRVVGTAQDAVTAYEIADAADQVLATVPQVAEGQSPRHTVGGLQPGQPTQVKVRVLRESGGAGSFSALSLGHALAATPVGVTGAALALGSLELSLDSGPNGSQCDTVYRITDVQLGQHLQADGSLAATEVFDRINTCGGFGPAPVVRGLTPDSDHVFVLTARNGDDVLTAPSPASPVLVTWALRPDAPTVTSDGLGGLLVVFDTSGNPSRTLFAVSVDSRFANLAGELVDDAVFGTRAEWNAGTGVPLQDLLPDTIHEVRLLARNAAGRETAVSPPGYARTAPAAPVSIEVVVTGDTSLQVQIAQGLNPSSTRYEVERVLPSTAAIGVSTSTRVDVGSLTPATRYSFRVRAVGGDDTTSAWVGPAERVLPPVQPAVPVVTARTLDGLTLQHAAAGDANPGTAPYAFTVDGRYVNAADGTLLTTTPDDRAFVPKASLTSIAVSGLGGATRHELRSVVRGVDGELVQSLPSTEATLPFTPTALGVTTGADPAHTLSLAWQAAGNPAGTRYVVERQLGSGSFGPAADVTTLTLVDGSSTPLVPGASYTYRVQAQVYGQASAFSATAGDTTWAVAPAAPVLQIPADGNATVLELTLPADENDASVRYAFQVLQGATSQWLRQVGGVESLTGSPEYRTRLAWGSVAITGLQPNLPYEVLARARNATPDPDQDGPSRTRYTAATPPASLGGTATQVQIQLSWPASAASSYRLLREAGTCTAPAQVYAGTATSYPDTAVQPGTTYCYRVHGLNGDTPPQLSVTYASATLATVSAAPLVPTDLVVTNAAGAQTASASDSPIRTLTPHFSARHQDQGGSTSATRVRLRVRRDAGATLIYDEWATLSPALAAGQKCPDLVLPYLIAPLPFTAADGFAVGNAPSTGSVYVLEGGSTAVHRLHLATNQWDPAPALPALPVAAGAGSGLAYLASNNTLYAIAGGGDNEVYRHILGGASWTALGGTPCGAMTGATALAAADVAGNVFLFLYPGSGTFLFVYNLTTGDRDCNHLTLPFTPSNGVGMTVASNTLFTVQGGGTGALAATSLSGISAQTHAYNAWRVHATGVPDDMRMGGSLITVGSLRLAVGSGNSGPSKVYRYDFTAALPASGTFTHLADQPANSQTFNGNRLAYDNGSSRLYVLRGNGREIWYSTLSTAALAGYPGANRSGMVLDTRTHDFSMAFEDSDGQGALATDQSFNTAP